MAWFYYEFKYDCWTLGTWQLLMGVGEWLITIDSLVVGELPIGPMVIHLYPKTNEMYH